MKVHIRKKKLSDGSYSLLLDYHYKNERRRDYLNIHIKGSGEDTKEKMMLARIMAGQKQIEIASLDAGVVVPDKRRTDFVKFYKDFVSSSSVKSPKTLLAPLYVFVKFFGKEVIPSRLITEDVCREFRKYLSLNFTNETPNAYFSKFKMVLSSATKAEIFSANPASDIRNPKPAHNILRKEVLSFKELTALQKSYCPNSEVKRAFLFSCYTGLRMSDVRSLRWGQIDFHRNEVGVIQSKSGKPIHIPLGASAKSLLGKKSDKEKVFSLKSKTSVGKAIKVWCKNAGVIKHITYHCSRHTYGTLLLLHGTDLKTTSELLGHASTRETEKYAHVLDSMKRKAVSKLPQLKYSNK